MKIKCNFKLLFLGVINLLIGVLFLAINADTLVKISFFLIGGLVIVNGTYSLYKSIKTKNSIDIINSIIDICFGIVLLWFHKTFMIIIVAIYLIAIPVIRIIMNKDHKTQLIIELPRLIIGLVLILLTPEGVLSILFKVIGVLLLVIGIIGVIGSFCIERYIDSKK